MRNLAAVTMLLLLSCGGMTPEEEVFYGLQVQARAAITSKLRDPSSAEFAGWRVDPKTKTACGTINAKNGFGGFTGPTAFVFKDGQALINDGGETYQIASLHCIGALYEP